MTRREGARGASTWRRSSPGRGLLLPGGGLEMPLPASSSWRLVEELELKREKTRDFIAARIPLDAPTVSRKVCQTRRHAQKMRQKRGVGHTLQEMLACFRVLCPAAGRALSLALSPAHARSLVGSTVVPEVRYPPVPGGCLSGRSSTRPKCSLRPPACCGSQSSASVPPATFPHTRVSTDTTRRRRQDGSAGATSRSCACSPRLQTTQSRAHLPAPTPPPDTQNNTRHSLRPTSPSLRQTRRGLTRQLRVVEAAGFVVVGRHRPRVLLPGGRLQQPQRVLLEPPPHPHVRRLLLTSSPLPPPTGKNKQNSLSVTLSSPRHATVPR
eukprot:2973869-Rhodomonas_salina.1